MNSEKIKIVCFMCNWVFCNETEPTDNQKRQAPIDFEIVRVMCIGRIDPVVVLEAFENGVDGILIIGCTPPDCHFVDGNLYAENTVNLLRKVLGLTGLDPQRLTLRWSSPMEGVKLISILNDFAAQIQKIGGSPLSGGMADEQILLNVSTAKRVVADFRLRVLKGRERELIENGNVYGEEVSGEDFGSLINEAVEEEFIRHKIHLITRVPLSVKQIAEALDMKTDLVLRHIVEMRRQGRVMLDHIEETTPSYKSLGGQ